ARRGVGERVLRDPRRVVRIGRVLRNKLDVVGEAGREGGESVQALIGGGLARAAEERGGGGGGDQSVGGAAMGRHVSSTLPQWLSWTGSATCSCDPPTKSQR